MLREVIVLPAALYVHPLLVTLVTRTVYVPRAVTLRLKLATPLEFVFELSVTLLPLG